MDVNSGAPAPTRVRIGLCQMPYDIIILILHSLHSVSDLYSTLGTFPQYKYIFRRNPAAFMSSALRNAIHPLAMQHALAALYAPPMDSSTDTEDLGYFVQQYFEETFPFPTVVGDLIRLDRIYGHVSNLALMYAHTALYSMGVGDPHDNHRMVVLSDVERARLQRAFFRYEVYCQAFPTARKTFVDGFGYFAPDEHYLSPTSQFALFVSRLQIHEVEELSCVYRFYTSVAADKYDRIGGNFINDVEGLVWEFETWPESVDDDTATRGGMTKERYHRNSVSVDDIARLDPGLVPLDGGKRLHRHNDFLASLGASTMAALLDGPDDEDTQHFLGCCRPLRGSWADAVDVQTEPHGLDLPSEYLPADVYNAGPSRPGPGYYLFRTPSAEPYLSADLDANVSVLRDRAYIFWDGDRVRDPRVIRGLIQARLLSLEEPSEETNAAQEFLPTSSNARIARRDMKRLMHKYDWVRPGPGENIDPISEALKYRSYVDE